jgi:hypothetical protein
MPEANHAISGSFLGLSRALYRPTSSKMDGFRSSVVDHVCDEAVNSGFWDKLHMGHSELLATKLLA